MKEKCIKYLKFVIDITYTILVSIICFISIVIMNYIVLINNPEGSDLEGFGKGITILSALLILTTIIKISILFYEFVKKE